MIIYDDFLKKEIAQLANRDLLESLATSAFEELSSSMTFALEATSRTWLMLRDSQLQAMSSWRPLPWDSEVLQYPSGCVGGLWAEGEYAEQCNRLETVLQACTKDAEQHNILFLSLRLSEESLSALHAAETVGFRIIESYLTFRRTTEDVPPQSSCVYLSCSDEAETVANLAFQALQFYRFFIDPLIPKEFARHSRREWVRNAFKGRADAIYVAKVENCLAGFIILKSKVQSSGKKIGVIDLIAVAPEYTGRGIGSALIAQAIQHYHGKVSAVEVGTQGKNIQAIRLYNRMGFQMVRSEFSLHRHSKPM